MSVSVLPAKAILRQLGARTKQMRLHRGFTRAALSRLCGVPESTIKRFESTGEIGTKALVNIFISLEAVDQVTDLAKASAPLSMADVMQVPRQRGKRSDAGRSRMATDGDAS